MSADIIFSAIIIADSTDATTIKAAILGALALVLSTTIPAFLARRQHEPRIVALLRADASRAENRVEKLQKEIDRLERVCWSNGIDPVSGKKVVNP